ncbi:MAG: hypothetical protein WAR39_06995 [Prevotella sp.]
MNLMPTTSDNEKKYLLNNYFTGVIDYLCSIGKVGEWTLNGIGVYVWSGTSSAICLRR